MSWQPRWSINNEHLPTLRPAMWGVLFALFEIKLAHFGVFFGVNMEKPLSIKLCNLLLSEFPNSSQNLAKFARSKEYSRLKEHYRVYRDASGDLHIGFCDDIYLNGRRLLKIACGDFRTFAYSNCQMQDVTEWFISEYKEKGMCAYTDMRHEWDMDDPDEDIGAGSTRVCIHCGKHQMMKVKMVRKTWWEDLQI